MSENLRPGDLVQVVRNYCTCGAGERYIGFIFTLTVSRNFSHPFCTYCNGRLSPFTVWQFPNPDRPRLISNFPSNILKKIPPLSELESETDSIFKVIPAHENAH